MCKYINHAPQTEDVFLKIPADLSCSGKEKWKNIKIDKCIAPIIDALQKGGIDMRGSCCGHETGIGEIQLQDRRILIITSMPFNKYLKKKKAILAVINEEKKQ